MLPSSRLLLLTTSALLAACGGGGGSPPITTPPPSAPPSPDPVETTKPFRAESWATFDEPWAMTFLPDGRLLVTEKSGKLKLFNPTTRTAGDIAGVPAVAYAGQGGLGDVILDPRFSQNGWIYLSYAEAGSNNTRGAAVARARLSVNNATGGGVLSDLQVIWRQEPKVAGDGHYSHRLAFAPDGAHLFITSGERQKFDPAQDMTSNLGKIVRLNEDGSVPADNPFATQGGVTAQIWTSGHRNLLGIAFDGQGRLWNHEMGPKGGDELNLVVRGDNYGYPIVSNGDHYDGTPIPDHSTRPEFHAPAISWTPVISPAGLIFYNGALFPQWRGQALIGGLSSQALVRVRINGDASATEVGRYAMGERIREVEQGPDGAVWLLEDGDDARLLKLMPSSP